MSFTLYFRQHFTKTQNLFFVDDRLYQIFPHLFLTKHIHRINTKVQSPFRSLYVCEAPCLSWNKSLFVSWIEGITRLFTGHYYSKIFQDQGSVVYINNFKPGEGVLSNLHQKRLEYIHAIRLKNYNI